MSPVSEQTDRAARWDELIAVEGRVGKALKSAFVFLRAEQRVELILDAELELIEKWQAGDIDWPGDPAAWLISATNRDALDLIKTMSRRATHAAGLAGTDYEGGEALAAEAEHERAIAEQNAHGLYILLSPTQRHVAVLRWSAGLDPRAIGKQLKLSRRTVYRHLDAITHRLRGAAGELAAGEFPRAWEELICGHVAGTLSARDRAKAATLIEANSDAQLYALALRRAGDQLAALIPPAALLEEPDTHRLLGRIGDRASDLAAVVRDAIENAAAAGKHQIANVFGRAAETAPAIANSPRSGAGAILASCVLAASGGSVCVISGTTPTDLADIFGDEKPKLARKSPARKPAAAAVARATARPTPLPRPKPKRPAAAPSPAPRAPAPTAPPASSPGQEFDPIAGSAQAAPQVSAPSPTPAASSAGGGEFDGP